MVTLTTRSHLFRHPPPGCRHIVLPLRRGLCLKPYLAPPRPLLALKALSNFRSRLAADMSNLVVFQPSRTRTVYLAQSHPVPRSQSPGGPCLQRCCRGVALSTSNCSGGRQSSPSAKASMSPSAARLLGCPTPRPPVDRARTAAVAVQHSLLC
jgi:hypothetical protein